MRCLLTSTSLETKFKSLTILNFVKGMKNPHALLVDVRIVQPLWKTTCHDLLVLKMCTVSVYDPSILLPRETLEYVYKEV